MNSVGRFLESRGMVEEALNLATDPDYKFELAVQLGKLEVAKAIAEESHSESKWKQLGELAVSAGKLDVAEECLRHAKDLSGLLLLYSAVCNAGGLEKLSVSAKENGKSNVAFLSLFLLGKVEDCVELLIESNRIPEAAVMARTYLPSQVSRIIILWRNDLKKINPKAAESLADPEEYPNLFPDWESALAVELESKEQRSNYIPAANYLSYINGVDEELTEDLQGLDINGDEPTENGHGLQEDEEYIAEDFQGEELHETDEEGFEDAEQILDGDGDHVEEMTDEEEPSADS